MKPTLGVFYPRGHELPVKSLAVLHSEYPTSGHGSHFFQLPLPTECVVRAAEFVVPTMARVYTVDLFQAADGALFTYDELRQLPDFKGTSGYTQILLCEVFDDVGSDGHTDYWHVGYRYVPAGWFTPPVWQPRLEAPQFMRETANRDS